MKSTITALIIAAGLALTLAGCSKIAEDVSAENPALTAPVPAGMIRGEVLETIDTGSYTYALIDLGDEQRWYAGPVTQMAVGDIVQTTEGMAMGQFTSNSLGRTFDNMYFVGMLGNLSNPVMPADHPATPAQRETTQVDDVTVAELEEGQDIAWVYANKNDLADQQISLRGKVVKYNEGILGWNFIHIQDGSGDAAEGNNDLTVTSKATTAVGDTVLVAGTVILDKDFGAGYSFPIMMEDASITVE